MASYKEYVIVAGGRSLDGNIVQDDIEVLNWMENSHWSRVSIKLPVPMRTFGPIISDDYLLIAGYTGKNVYKLPVAIITASTDGKQNSATSSRCSYSILHSL